VFGYQYQFSLLSGKACFLNYSILLSDLVLQAPGWGWRKTCECTDRLWRRQLCWSYFHRPDCC